MSSDDFGTVNAKRGDIELLREHVRQLTARVEALERGAAMPPAAPPQVRPSQRPLVHDASPIPEAPVEERSRLPLIVGAAVIALAIIAWLIWRASDRGTTAVVEERPTVTTGTTDTVSTADDTIEPASPVTAALTASPASHDYGVIRKGTRAVRQYELTNTTDEPISIQVARSACRCLYYDHAPVIPPKAKERLTITVDAARAKAGELREEVRITSKADAAIATTVDVNATIR